MKKAFTIAIAATVISILAINNVYAYTAAESKSIIRGAITKYKAKNYAGCISDLRMFTEVDPTSAVAWYYLGNAYMNVSMKDEAKSAYDKVILLNNIPILTSYSIQAELCMDDPTKCKYQVFNSSEIEKLRSDPVNFMEQYLEKINTPEVKDESVTEIDKLIDGSYPNNIHPDAEAFIRQERVKIKQSEFNASKTKSSSAASATTTSAPAAPLR